MLSISSPARTHPRRAVVVIGILAGLIVLAVWFNFSREELRDNAVRANLESIVAQADIVAPAEGSYGVATEGDCTAGVFADPTIQSALIAIRVANGYEAEYCNATTDSYVLVAPRPHRGLYQPSSVYWCADSTGVVCAQNSLGAGITACSCH